MFEHFISQLIRQEISNTWVDFEFESDVSWFVCLFIYLLLGSLD